MRLLLRQPYSIRVGPLGVKSAGLVLAGLVVLGCTAALPVGSTKGGGGVPKLDPGKRTVPYGVAVSVVPFQPGEPALHLAFGTVDWDLDGLPESVTKLRGKTEKAYLDYRGLLPCSRRSNRSPRPSDLTHFSLLPGDHCHLWSTGTTDWTNHGGDYFHRYPSVTLHSSSSELENSQMADWDRWEAQSNWLELAKAPRNVTSGRGQGLNTAYMIQLRQWFGVNVGGTRVVSKQPAVGLLVSPAHSSMEKGADGQPLPPVQLGWIELKDSETGVPQRVWIYMPFIRTPTLYETPIAAQEGAATQMNRMEYWGELASRVLQSMSEIAEGLPYSKPNNISSNHIVSTTNNCIFRTVPWSRVKAQVPAEAQRCLTHHLRRVGYYSPESRNKVPPELRVRQMQTVPPENLQAIQICVPQKNRTKGSSTWKKRGPYLDAPELRSSLDSDGPQMDIESLEMYPCDNEKESAGGHGWAFAFSGNPLENFTRYYFWIPQQDFTELRSGKKRRRPDFGYSARSSYYARMFMACGKGISVGVTPVPKDDSGMLDVDSFWRWDIDSDFDEIAFCEAPQELGVPNFNDRVDDFSSTGMYERSLDTALRVVGQDQTWAPGFGIPSGVQRLRSPKVRSCFSEYAQSYRTCRYGESMLAVSSPKKSHDHCEPYARIGFVDCMQKVIPE